MPQSTEGKSQVSVQEIYQASCYEGLNVCFSLKKTPIVFLHCSSKEIRTCALRCRVMTCTLSRDGAALLTSATTVSAASLLFYFPSLSVVKLRATPSWFFLIFLSCTFQMFPSHILSVLFPPVVCVLPSAIRQLTPGTLAILNPSSSGVTVVLSSSDRTTGPAQSQLMETSKQCHVPSHPRRTARS